ncbi:trehalose utilization [Aquibacillus halophilus]|uniref:Trehalose utilization n=1 Tax=Aquibacillus halophilus TaxID=930132 RepID=A0A6A8DAE4_9BACI|nr:ThuA domain-containing protein [Aquibacillus halophilus]MRH42675.1 trehalose utilization [Aquibacillus halophilus]
MTKRIVAALGDFYHDRDLAVQSLEAAVKSIEGIEIEYKHVDELVESLQTNPDAVILFAENRINPEDDQVKTWMDNDAALAINRFVENGGGWLAWHSGLASYDNIEAYTSMLHGYFKYHPEKHQVVSYTFNPDSNFIDDGQNFEILDEHYFVACDVENTSVFLTSDSVDGSSIAGWYHDYGKGKVVCLIPAHLEEGLMHPVVQKLLINSIKKVSDLA